jgi:hypothetical protein
MPYQLIQLAGNHAPNLIQKFFTSSFTVQDAAIWYQRNYKVEPEVIYMCKNGKILFIPIPKGREDD